MIDQQTSQNSEPTITIGDVVIPLWQFDIYYKEADKYTIELASEVENSKYNSISKKLIRAVHTLSGISNTLGIAEISKVGYVLEEWLTQLVDVNTDYVLTPSDLQIVTRATNIIIEMVQSIRNKTLIHLDNTQIIADLTTKIKNTNSDHIVEKEPEESVSENIMDDDWFEKEMQTIEDSLTDAFDEGASDWLVNIDSMDTVESTSDLSLDSIMSELEAANKMISPAVAHFDSVIPHIPTTNDELSNRSTSNKEIKDFQSYLNILLPTSDIKDDISDESIKDIFVEEASEIFETLPTDIDKWSSSNGIGREHEKIKRALHTLKGSSRMAGFFRFGTIVHNIETIVETGHAKLTREEIPDFVQSACDALAQELEHIKNSNTPSGIASMLNDATSEILMDLNIISEVTSIKRSDDLINQDTTIVNNTVTTSSNEESNVASVLRVSTDKVDALANHLGKAGMMSLRVEDSATRMSAHIAEMSINMDRLRKLLKDVEIQAETQMKSRLEEAKREDIHFDPLEFDRFTRLQELTRMTAEALNDINNSQSEVIKGIITIQDSVAENMIISEDMQHTVMSVRTVPVQSLGRRLERLVRQSCRDTGKQAALFLDGDLEVDSGVLNKVVAPLEHLIRNSLAHGIETPEVRKNKGKPEKGTISLQVKQRGNDIVFKLTDDGNGINREAVQKRAQEKGIITEDTEITQEKANQLIFDPGFSTSEAISELSGRGVGMSVVTGEIAGMGGRIAVHSIANEGTIFDLTVPAYMAVISMVPIKAKNINYAVPSALVRDVIVVRDTILLDAYETGILVYNNESYPFYNLAEAAGLTASDLQRNNRVLLADDTTGVAAIHIDSLGTDRNLVMKPLCRAVAALPGLLGASVAGDGTPLLVINPVELRASVQNIEHIRSKVITTEKKAKVKSDITVMVVDDSLTVRRITQKFLDREGFKCVLAKDGFDAIEKIQEFGKPDIFLLDIEMPNMDGFQLTEHIRTSVSKDIPIIMISSRSIDKYSAHAKSLGVNRSLGKPYQEPELLSSILELTGIKTHV